MTRLTGWQWWRQRLFELGIALMLATGVIVLTERVGHQLRASIPVSQWFVVNEIFVPDHPMGSNPNVLYDRDILEPFIGFWIVEVQRQVDNGMWTTECSGHGTNEYEPTDVIEHNTVDWEWMLGRPCAVPPGYYRLKVTYTLTRLEWPAKELFVLSNEFTVSP